MQEFGPSDLTIIFQRLLQDYGKFMLVCRYYGSDKKNGQNLVKFMGSLKGKIWPY